MLCSDNNQRLRCRRLLRRRRGILLQNRELGAVRLSQQGRSQWISRGSSFLGGFSAPPGDDVAFTYITTVGKFGCRGDGYSHSLLFDVNLTEKLNYVLQSDLVSTNDNDANPAT